MTTATVRTATNPYLAANFGPVTEEITAFDLPVTGCLPDYLNGRYLRNGPNPVVDPDAATYHWFTGSGMVHGVRIRDGRAEWYRNRWVRAGDVAQALGEQRAPGPVHAGLDFAANTNVIGHAGRTLAIAEGGGLPYELTEGLKTVGATDLEGTLRGGYTAHPLKDPATGELHAVSYWWGHGCHVRYSVIDIAGRVRLALDVRVTGSPMMHCFSLTERFVVLYDLPVTFDVDQAVTTAPRALRPFARAAARRVIGRRRVPEPIAAPMTVRARNELFPYKWDPTHQARVGVFARKDPYPRVRWFDIAPCYVFHPLNAYDDDGCVTVDLVRHDRMFANKPLPHSLRGGLDVVDVDERRLIARLVHGDQRFLTHHGAVHALASSFERDAVPEDRRRADEPLPHIAGAAATLRWGHIGARRHQGCCLTLELTPALAGCGRDAGGRWPPPSSRDRQAPRARRSPMSPPWRHARFTARTSTPKAVQSRNSSDVRSMTMLSSPEFDNSATRSRRRRDVQAA